MIFPNVWELKKAARWRQKGNIMAKYLGGINDPHVRIHKITPPGPEGYDFVIHYTDYNEGSFTKKRFISNHIKRYEVVTSEKKLSDYSLTWGLAGYLAGGFLGAAIGAVLGGSSSTVKSHVVFCELRNGWQFALALSDSELDTWKIYMNK